MENGKFLQELIVIESGEGQKKDKPCMINVWGKTQEEIEQGNIKVFKGSKVTCECHMNGYSYYTSKHGRLYGYRANLITIKKADS
jgi:hypothetical protein